MRSQAAEADHAFTSSAASVRVSGVFLSGPAAAGPLSSSTPAHYLLAMVSVAVAVALRASLHPLLGFEAPLLTFVVPTVVAAVFGGVGSALLATALSTVAGAFCSSSPWVRSGQHARPIESVSWCSRSRTSRLSRSWRVFG